jgi:hypothetical protein
MNSRACKCGKEGLREQPGRRQEKLQRST